MNVRMLTMFTILGVVGLIGYALYLGDVELVTELITALGDALRALTGGAGN